MDKSKQRQQLAESDSLECSSAVELIVTLGNQYQPAGPSITMYVTAVLWFPISRPGQFQASFMIVRGY